jgi:hypothetical protein
VLQDIAILNNIVLAATTGEHLALGTNGRTDLDIYNTRLNANYNMTPLDYLFSELKMNRSEYADPLVSSRLYVANLYLNHGFTSKFVLGGRRGRRLRRCRFSNTESDVRACERPS